MPSEFKDKISEDDAKTIKKAVEEAKKVLDDKDADKDDLEKAAQELSEKIMPIGAKMYQQADDGKKDKGDSKSKKKSDSKDDDAVEGEVVDK